MNGKKIACIILLMFIAILAYAGQVLHKNALAKRAAATQAESDTQSARGALTLLDTKVGVLRSESEDVRRFLVAWTPYVDKVQLQSDVETTISASMRNAGVVTLSNKFEVRDTRTDLVLPKIIRASLTIEDDYAKTLNWIGELERKLPLSRVMSCKISGGENGRQVRTEIVIEVPLPNLRAVPVPVVKI